MIVDDERNVSCGGDPITFLKSVMKGLYYQLEPGQDAKILVLHEKYPFEKNIFEGIANSAKVKLVTMDDDGNEIHLLIRREAN